MEIIKLCGSCKEIIPVEVEMDQNDSLAAVKYLKNSRGTYICNACFNKAAIRKQEVIDIYNKVVARNGEALRRLGEE